MSKYLESILTLSPTLSLFLFLIGKFNKQVDAGICGDEVRKFKPNGFSRLSEKENIRE